ncbi:VOC family protein [Microvirga flavescens]|uniref:VOC family protein n=1 Tax=Microvirga flavescens TaxID=2249811 RepID=UPI000DDB945D|nr:VOC family protein [Microvirga flavescens]
MQPRLTLVTLGVADVARATAFYEAWGWKASSASQPSVTFFQANGLALALFGRSDLANDAHVEDRPTGFAAITLAYNARSKAEADEVFALALKAGARELKPLQDAFWGGYSGYFADPDGHVWEVAWNPFFPLDEQGHMFLPDSQS